MADDLATLQVAITASLKDFSTKMGEFEGILKGTEENTKKTTASTGGMTTAIAMGTIAANAAMWAFNELKGAIEGGIHSADDDAVAMARLTSSLGTGAESIKKWAIAQQNSTRFSRDDTLSAANSLSIHKLNREEIEKILPVIEDYASKKGVSATATAEAFGRAIEFGTTRGLRPYGIQLEKNGSQQDVFNELISQGQGKVKGMAVQLGQIGLGPMVIFNNQWKEIAETFGAKIIPYISDFLKVAGPGILTFLEKTLGLLDKVLKGWQALGSFFGYMAGGKSAKEAAAMTRAEYAESPKPAAVAEVPTGTEKSGLSTVSKGDVKAELKASTEFWKSQHEMILSNLEVFKAKAEAAIKDLDNALKDSSKTVEEWYIQSSEQISKSYEKQIVVQREIIRTTSDVNAKREASNKIALLEIEREQKLTELSIKYTDAMKKQAEEKEKLNAILAEADVSATKGVSGTGGLKKQQDAEIALLKIQNAKKLDEARKLHATKDQLDKMSSNQAIALNNKMLENDKALQVARLQLASETAGNIADIFQGLYEITGKKSVEMFNLMKAAQIAQTIINTYSSATSVFAGMTSSIPGPVGIALGIVGAVAAIALGLANVAKITATKMEKAEAGGFLQGPSHAAGGIAMEVEGGEYIHSRAAVNTYGTRAMDAINRGFVSPAALQSVISTGNIPSITSGTNMGTGAGKNVTVQITNLQDPRIIDRHLASSEGRTSTINWMGQNKMAIRKQLGV